MTVTTMGGAACQIIVGLLPSSLSEIAATRVAFRRRARQGEGKRTLDGQPPRSGKPL